MRRILAAVLVAFVALPAQVAAQSQADAQQIAEAVSALPGPLRDGAEVRAFRGGELVTLRVGTNGLICLGDDPARAGWHVSCYHEDLEPFMARGRELRAQGIIERAAIDSARLTEIESGALKMPDGSRALYSLFAEAGKIDPATGDAVDASGLWVIYIPYATEESTGLPAASSRQRPWLMFPGTPWAHLMIPR